MITRRELITGATASIVGLQYQKEISHKIKNQFPKPKFQLGEIWAIVFGDFLGFDKPDPQEHILLVSGYRISIFDDSLGDQLRKKLLKKPLEFIYFFQPLGKLHNPMADIFLLDCDLKHLACYRKISS